MPPRRDGSPTSRPSSGHPSAYGALLRDHRMRAGLSIRELARATGLSHSFLADVENGHHGPLRPEHERKVRRVLKTLTSGELVAAREMSRRIAIVSTHTPESYHRVIALLARRIEERTLDDTTLRSIEELLDDSKP